MQKRLIFTVSSGRSGTQYLAYLLRGLPGLNAWHEPEPGFQHILPHARHDSALALRFLREAKLPAIYARPEQIYVETSHYCAKGFLEPMVSLGVVPDLIILLRNARQVATSWYLIGASMQNLLAGGLPKHIISPAESNFLPVNNWKEFNDYQLCYWYALETEARATHYERWLPEHGGRVIRLTLDGLVADDDYERLLEWVDLPREIVSSRLADITYRQRVMNYKEEAKARHNRFEVLQSLDLDVLENEVKSRVHK